MSKYILAFFCLCSSLVTYDLSAAPFELGAYDATIELRAAALFPSSSRFREVYSDTVGDYQVQGSVIFCDHYEVWANYSWFSKSKKHGPCYKTKIDVNNGSLGLNYVFNTCYNVDYYLGLGLVVGGINLKNKSCCLHEHESKCAVGGIVRSGIRYTFCNGIFLDGFLDYLYQPVDYHHNVDIGGLKLGAGLGYRF